LSKVTSLSNAGAAPIQRDITAELAERHNATVNAFGAPVPKHLVIADTDPAAIASYKATQITK
jgi:hypothetical protein